MGINSNNVFDIINAYPPLADWFERNNDEILSFGLMSKERTSFNNYNAGADIISLDKMLRACLLWLNSSLNISNEKKAKNATLAIMKVYVEEVERMSYSARKKYGINFKTLQFEDNEKFSK